MTSVKIIIFDGDIMRKLWRFVRTSGITPCAKAARGILIIQLYIYIYSLVSFFRSLKPVFPPTQNRGLIELSFGLVSYPALFKIGGKRSGRLRRVHADPRNFSLQKHIRVHARTYNEVRLYI